jgi:hypothetical protein
MNLGHSHRRRAVADCTQHHCRRRAPSPMKDRQPPIQHQQLCLLLDPSTAALLPSVSSCSFLPSQPSYRDLFFFLPVTNQASKDHTRLISHGACTISMSVFFSNQNNAHALFCVRAPECRSQKFTPAAPPPSFW